MTLTVGCIGAGYFAAFHYEAWSRIDGVRLAASVDTEIERARRTNLPAYTDANAMMREVAPDIVDIITPPPSHFAMIRAALAHKPKAIICQKPFCQSMDEARDAAQLAASHDVPLVVHENFRFQPWYRTIKDVIDRGEIGDPLQVTFRLRPGDGQGPHAYMDRQPYFQEMERFLVHETAVHWIDVFRFLLGAPRRVFADLRQLNPSIAGEDAGYILFDQGAGKRAIFDGNRLLDHAASNTRCTMGEGLVEGTKGTLSLHGDGSLTLRDFGTETQRTILPATDVARFGGDCVYHLQNHVVQAVTTERKPENTADEYLTVMAIEAAIYNSQETGAWIAPTY